MYRILTGVPGTVLPAVLLQYVGYMLYSTSTRYMYQVLLRSEYTYAYVILVPGGSGTFVHASVDSTTFYYELNENSATSSGTPDARVQSTVLQYPGVLPYLVSLCTGTVPIKKSYPLYPCTGVCHT